MDVGALSTGKGKGDEGKGWKGMGIKGKGVKGNGKYDTGSGHQGSQPKFQGHCSIRGVLAIHVFAALGKRKQVGVPAPRRWHSQHSVLCQRFQVQWA